MVEDFYECQEMWTLPYIGYSGKQQVFEVRVQVDKAGNYFRRVAMRTINWKDTKQNGKVRFKVTSVLIREDEGLTWVVADIAQMSRKNQQNPKCESETETLGNTWLALLLAWHTGLKAQWIVKEKSQKTGGEFTLENIGSGILIEHIAVEIWGSEIGR